jgi:L-threonylcarbamoyladenylate synthase
MQDYVSSEEMERAVEVLENGGVIIHPTDTCYGLACSMFSKKGIEKLYALKGMPLTKPISILVSSEEMARNYGEFNRLADMLAEKYWPGPLTAIVRKSSKVPIFFNASTPTIGIRFPEHETTIDLIEQLGHPILTTSANEVGGKEPYISDEIDLEADFLLDGGRLPFSKTSTIIDVSDGTVHLLREGAVEFGL